MCRKEMKEVKDIENIDKKPLLSSSVLANSIKNLSNPRFLGSIHLKNTSRYSNLSSVDNLLSGELELNVNKSLKNMLFNPITKILILLMIVFNLIWFLLLYLV